MVFYSLVKLNPQHFFQGILNLYVLYATLESVPSIQKKEK
jgi:hypothetical protein